MYICTLVFANTLLYTYHRHLVLHCFGCVIEFTRFYEAKTKRVRRFLCYVFPVFNVVGSDALINASVRAISYDIGYYGMRQ